MQTVNPVVGIAKDPEQEKFTDSFISEMLNRFSPLEVADIVANVRSAAIKFLQRRAKEAQEGVEQEQQRIELLYQRAKGLEGEILREEEIQIKSSFR